MKPENIQQENVPTAIGPCKNYKMPFLRRSESLNLVYNHYLSHLIHPQPPSMLEPGEFLHRQLLGMFPRRKIVPFVKELIPLQCVMSLSSPLRGWRLSDNRIYALIVLLVIRCRNVILNIDAASAPESTTLVYAPTKATPPHNATIMLARTATVQLIPTIP